MSKKFAVFDIDGTISRNSLFLQIIDELLANGQLPANSRSILDEKLAKYQTRTHDDAFLEYTQTSVDMLFGNLQTIPVDEYRLAVDRVLARSKDRVYAYTRNLIASLKKQGYFLIALSGSEMYSVQEFGTYYGFDIAIGETYVQENAAFTGEVLKVTHNKDVTLKKVLLDNDLDFAGSIGIGDTKSDIKILELVETPIAFNPEQQLLAHAMEHHWKIVVERKNVIYTLESRDGSYILA